MPGWNGTMESVFVMFSVACVVSRVTANIAVRILLTLAGWVVWLANAAAFGLLPAGFSRDGSVLRLGMLPKAMMDRTKAIEIVVSPEKGTARENWPGDMSGLRSSQPTE